MEENTVHPHVRGVNEWDGISYQFGNAVHPHVRGVNPSRYLSTMAVIGSSPRAWG